MKRNIIYFALIAFFFTACDIKEDYVVEKSKVVDIAGEYYNIIYGYDSLNNLIPYTSYAVCNLYNTAADVDNELWFEDHSAFDLDKYKLSCNVKDKTFSGISLEVDTNTTVDITGRIIPEASVKKSGFVADSFYCDIVFRYTTGDPDEVYVLAGFRRTGFLEDEP